MDHDELSQFADGAERAHKYELESIVPKIIVGGVTGAGKSSLLNAILSKHAFKVGATEPVTREYDEAHIESGDAPISFIDSPGFSEADQASKDYAGRIRRLIAEKAHVFLLVVGAPNRGLDVESKWLSAARTESFFTAVPGLVVVNKIDMLPPIQDWNPKKINLVSPASTKEKGIADYLSYIISLKEFQPFSNAGRLIPVSAGESYNDPCQYNIDALRLNIFDLLPDAAKIEFGRQAHLSRQAAETIMNRYALAAAAEVCFNIFGSGSDAPILISLQTAMIIHIGKIYGQHFTWNFALSLLGTVATTLLGKSLVVFIISISVPGVKNFIGPPIAYGLTMALGAAAIEICASTKANASEQEIQNYARHIDADKYRQVMEQAKAECPPQDDLKDKRIEN